MNSIKTFEEFNYIKNLHEILENKISTDEIESILMLEFFGFKFNFVNPFKKKKVKKLADELVKHQVELVKISLESNRFEREMEELEAEMEELEDSFVQKKTKSSSGYGSSLGKKQSYGKSSSRGSSRDDDPFSAKRSAVESHIKSIEDKMDLLGEDNEKLKKFIELQKIESKIKANELIIKLADDEQKKILQNFNAKKTKQLKSLSDRLEKQADEED